MSNSKNNDPYYYKYISFITCTTMNMVIIYKEYKGKDNIL